MIKLNEVNKIYKAGRQNVYALNKASLEIDKNSFVLVKGPSGSGKSTLLFTIGGLLKPSSGELSIFGEDIYNMSDQHRRRIIARKVGFVFQSYYLLPYLTVKENIQLQKTLPFIDIDNEYMNELIEKLNLQDRLNHKPAQLSVGEKQRVAMLRSLVSHPELILADEPTGNLDPENAEIVLGFLDEFKKQGGTVVIVSHGSDADRFADKIINLNKGMISSN